MASGVAVLVVGVLVIACDARAAPTSKAGHLAPSAMMESEKYGSYGQNMTCQATWKMIRAELVASMMFRLMFVVFLGSVGAPPPPPWAEECG